MSQYRFDCGCTFDIISPANVEGQLPKLRLNFEEISLDCPAVWNMLGKGLTKGVFQLESPLGKQWTKRLKPTHIEHLIALGSILRPGALRSKNAEGVSTTELYCRRKNLEEPVEYDHSILEPILKDTYGLSIFQEQSLLIARVAAGFNLQEADELRSAIAKKLPAKMRLMEGKFMAGAKNLGIVSEEKAQYIFNGIKESQRYQFNRCLSGKTKIKGLPDDIEFMYKNSTNYGYTLSMADDGKVQSNKIVDIQPSRLRDVMELTLDDGSSIKCTLNHKFPTSHGIKNVVEIIDLYSQGIKLYKYDNHCGTYLVGIHSIEFAGEEDTYDVTMAAPHHNFVTDQNIVTCNSHAACYAINGYQTAFCKTHFPLQFFCSYLFNAWDKQDPQQEIRELVNEARIMDIQIQPPDLKSMREHFSTDGKAITFGLGDIKGIAAKQIEKLQEAINNKSLEDIQWYDFLTKIAPEIGTSISEKLISAGALGYLNKGRREMLHELNIFDKLSDGEKKWILQRVDSFSSLKEALKHVSPVRKQGGGAHDLRRQKVVRGLLDMLMNPGCSLEDSPQWIAGTEELLLGVPITCSHVDSCDTTSVNTSCKEFINNKAPAGCLIMVVEVEKVREHRVKTGKNAGSKIAFLTINDGECSLSDVVCFSDVWKNYRSILAEGVVVIIQGEKDPRKGSLIIKQVWQANLT